MKDKIAKAKESAKKPINKIRRKKSDPVSSTKLPYITNETIAEHREEVLAGARKYIYPLQHSKHKIVWLSLAIFIITLLVFIVYSVLSLYRYQSTSTFMYRVTQIVPFPVARAGSRFVSYESYLFELRRNIHYYENQPKVNFESEEGKEQLEDIKKQAMAQVINDALVKQMADKQGVSVSSQEVDQEIALMRQQSRLGPNDRVFEDVLRDFWGWSLNDFKRSLRQQILTQKVASSLDKDAQAKASSALSEIKSGQDFAQVAAKYSEDADTKDKGGDYGIDIEKTNKNLSARVTDTIFQLQPGQTSEIIDTGYNSFEIVKVLSRDDRKARAAHILINIRDISEHIEEFKRSNSVRNYLRV